MFFTFTLYSCYSHVSENITPSKRKANDNFEINSNLSNKLIKLTPQIKQTTPSQSNNIQNNLTPNVLQPIMPLQQPNLTNTSNPVAITSQIDDSQDDSLPQKIKDHYSTITHKRFDKEQVDDNSEENDFELSEEQQEIYDACIEGYVYMIFILFNRMYFSLVMQEVENPNY